LLQREHAAAAHIEEVELRTQQADRVVRNLALAQKVQDEIVGEVDVAVVCAWRTRRASVRAHVPAAHAHGGGGGVCGGDGPRVTSDLARSNSSGRMRVAMARRSAAMT
jgi:hypothetical protein